MRHEGSDRHGGREGARGISVSPRLVFGVLLMAAGLLFTLDNFGLLQADDWLRFWPLALIAVGVGRFNSSTRGGNASGVIWILVGSVLLLDNVGLVPHGMLWPLGMVALGGYLISRALPGQQHGPGGDAEAENRLSAFVCMCGVNRRTRSEDFRGGEFTAIMGGVEVDLRKASIAEGPAVIDTFAFWGGIEIRVPDDWNVESQGIAVMGGFEDKSDPPADASKTLIVKGVAIMGGVEIKN